MAIDHFTRLDDQLSVGRAPKPEERAWLAAQGVERLLSLQSPDDLIHEGETWEEQQAAWAAVGINATNLPVTDFDGGDLLAHLDAATVAISRHLRVGPVYVHCSAGLNRSPSAVIAYLVSYRDLSVKKATKWVRKRHKCVPYGDVMCAWAVRNHYPLK